MLVLLLIVVPALLGCCVVAAARVALDRIAAAAVGCVLGTTAFTTLVFAASLCASLTPALLWSGVAVCAAAIVAMEWRFGCLRRWLELGFDATTFWLLVLLALVGARLGSRLLFHEGGELVTGILNAWGDVGWHFSLITRLAEVQSLPIDDPILAGTALVYPFLADFHSSMLLVAGASLRASVVVPACIFLPLFFILFFAFARQLLGRRSGALLALLLLLLGGSALGWTRAVGDYLQGAQPLWHFLLHLPREYSGSGADPAGHHFLNIITSSLLPQRAFLFGMPLAMAILLLLLPRGEGGRDARYALAGVSSGLLPLFHAHTVLVLAAAIPMLVLVDSRLAGGVARELRRRWAIYFLAALTIGMPEIAYYAAGEGTSGMWPRWGPGWTVGERNTWWFWLSNTGLLLPLTVIALFGRTPLLAKGFACTGLFVFAVGNLFLFAPWEWDNFKILIFWLVFSLPAIGHVSARCLDRRSWLTRAAVAGLVGVHVLSGSLDLWRIGLPSAPSWGEWDDDAVEMADELRRVTGPDAVVATAPVHNTPVALSGRGLYLGFPGHIWTHGKDFTLRLHAIEAFYEGRIQHLPEVQVDYALVGPAERARFAVVIDPAWELLAEIGAYQLHSIRGEAPVGEAEAR